jgi:O-Antigen ligase
MTTLIFGLGIGILLTLLVSIFFWSRVRFQWLAKVCNLLVLSLPFEYFPRLELAGGSWRISQLLVMSGFWIIAILILKKDNQLLSHKLHFASWYPLVFLIFSLPSFGNIQDLTRFIVHLVGTIFVFGAMILLTNFATHVWKILQQLALVLFGCSIFGLFQFVGDLVGIPPMFTLLREHYTKIVFGVPRVQGTAVEPLYFAGMLLIAIFVLIFWICERLEYTVNNKKTVILSGTKDPIPELFEGQTFVSKETPVTFAHSSLLNGNISQLISNPPQRIFRYAQDDGHIFLLRYLFIILSIILLVFLLTISKGTFGVLAILLLVVIPVLYFTFGFVKSFIDKYIFQSILIGILAFGMLFTFVNPVALLGEIGTNFVETIAGTSASAVERGMFVSEAVTGIKQNPIVGIGMGQYGDYVGTNLGQLNEDGKAIVNNVYLEIWLEEGILALFFFLFVLAQPIFILLKKMSTRRPPLRQSFKLAGLSLIFILIGYYIQWTLFSPIFIMPIFIMLGLAYNLNTCQD